jgi:hypothetical protein
MAGLGTNYVFSFNNFLFGGPGQGVQVTQVTGLEDLPNLRTQDDNRGYADGAFTGRDFLDSRNIIFSFQIMSNADGSMFDYLNAMKAALVPSRFGTIPLYFKMPDGATRLVNARVRARAITVDPEFTYGRAVATYHFYCPDPRIYDAGQAPAYQPQSINLSVSGSLGRVYPRKYKVGSTVTPWGYTVPGGTTPRYWGFVNAGNTTTYPTITVTGPCTNPTILNLSTGEQLRVLTTLGANDVLTMDTDFHTVQINGLNSRNLLSMPSRWFGLPAGTTTLGFSADSSSSGCIATIQWRNAYI